MEYATHKYIIIPEFKPLHAMARCFGPRRGPLKQPTPAPVDVIRDLISQMDTISVYEVEPKADGKTFSEPVLLTPTNYMLPYELIAAGVSAVIEDEPKENALKETVTTTVPVDVPVYVPVAPPTTGEPQIAINAFVATAPADTTTSTEGDSPVEVVIPATTDDSTDVETPEEAADTKYAGMTKAERKAARRAEAEAAKTAATV